MIRTRPLCFVCLLLITMIGIFIMITGGKSLLDTPAGSIFSQSNHTKVIIKGQIYKKTITSNYQIYYLKNNSTNDSRLLVYDSNFTNISIGKTITIQGTLESFSHATNPGNFDQKIYYAKKNIYGKITCKEIIKVEGKEKKLLEALFQWREKWKNLILQHMGEKYGGIIVTMILGDKEFLDSDMKELYQLNGISHILAISGLHISFIGVGIYLILRKMGLGFGMAGVLAVSILTLYLLMIGFSVSSFRAYVMLLLKIGADIFGRVYDMLTALMLGALLTILWQPLYLMDGGFYMSYGAIVGICVVLPKFHRRLKRKWLAGIGASLAINITLLPIILWFYYSFSTYSILSNLIIIPLTSPLLCMSFAGSFFACFAPTVGAFIFHGCTLLLRILENVCSMGTRLPMNQLVLGEPRLWTVFLYYLCLVVAISWRGKKKYYIWCSLVVSVVLMVYRPTGNLELTMLDVGQGDCIYFRGPEGKHYLIDGGSSDVKSVGLYRMESFLKSQGVGRLDYVFVTHGDSDHYSGIEELLHRQKVGIRICNLVLPTDFQEDDTLLSLAKLGMKNGSNVLQINAGDFICEGSMKVTCIQPAKENTYLVGNAASLVVEVEYGNFSALFTGDVEDEGEVELIKKIRGKTYDVLKVAHHGAKSSTSYELLKSIRPRIALISAGKGNSYGHPHKEVIERLQKIRCKIFNTQENGAIHLRTNGNSLTIW